MRKRLKGLKALLVAVAIDQTERNGRSSANVALGNLMCLKLSRMMTINLLIGGELRYYKGVGPENPVARLNQMNELRNASTL
jgi:hypothetical protein